MPHVQITLLEGRSTEQKRRIARRITDVLVEEGKANPEAVSVAFVDVASDSYARNGTLVCDKGAGRPEPK
jgi:4-oxalocrotonate tautomerase